MPGVSANALSSRRLSMSGEIKRGNLKIIKFYIKNGYDINKPGRRSWTPLHIASYYNQSKVIIILIQNGVRISPTLTRLCMGRPGWTPLHLAAEKNNVRCGELLLRNGASVKSIFQDVCDPLHIAVAKGHTEMVRLLLDYGADVNLRYNNNHNLFKLMREKMGYSISTDYKLPILHVSIILKFSKLTELLILNGADIHLKSGTGKTTLMQAVRVNDVNLVKYLLTKGVNVNDRDNYLKPVLYFTIFNDNTLKSVYSKEEFEQVHLKLLIVNQLLQAQVDVNARFSPNDKNDNRSLYHYAAQLGYESIIKLLLFNSDFDLSHITQESIFNMKPQVQLLTADMRRDRNYLRILSSQIRQAFIYTVSTIISRDMLGLPVCQPLLNMLKSNVQVNLYMNPTVQQQLIKFFVDKSSSMIDHMKQTKIGNTNFTYWQLATCKIDELTTMIAREEIFNGYEAFIKENYPCYGYIIKKRMNIAKTKRKLFRKFTEIIFNMYKGNLPYDCCESISTYFNLVELTNIFFYVNDV